MSTIPISWVQQKLTERSWVKTTPAIRTWNQQDEHRLTLVSNHQSTSWTLSFYQLRWLQEDRNTRPGEPQLKSCSPPDVAFPTIAFCTTVRAQKKVMTKSLLYQNITKMLTVTTHKIRIFNLTQYTCTGFTLLPRKKGWAGITKELWILMEREKWQRHWPRHYS